MAISDIPLLSMLRTKMQWHQERQRILADNVANSDTPNFRPRDLAPPKFDSIGPSVNTPVLIRTDPGHQAGSDTADSFQHTDSGFQIRPAGNAVSLEDEMVKVANNQMDFQAATTLYTKSLQLLKTAVGQK
jgi:flagellar basal-body rod protein FlgB